MLTNSETVFIDRDNAIDVQLWDDAANPGTPAKTNLTSATKVEIIVDDGNKYDSLADPTIVSFTAGGIVSLKLGTCFSEENTFNAQIAVYDAVNVNGILWNPKIVLDVKADSY